MTTKINISIITGDDDGEPEVTTNVPSQTTTKAKADKVGLSRDEVTTAHVVAMRLCVMVQDECTPDQIARMNDFSEIGFNLVRRAANDVLDDPLNPSDAKDLALAAEAWKIAREAGFSSGLAFLGQRSAF